jgi:hypothetical protein
VHLILSRLLAPRKLHPTNALCNYRSRRHGVEKEVSERSFVKGERDGERATATTSSSSLALLRLDEGPRLAMSGNYRLT